VQLKKNYAMVISTNAGLWRYIIGDTVEFTSLNPYRIKVTGRINHFINAFGEELIIENAEIALSKACNLTDSIIKEFTAAPVFFKDKSTGKHQWLIEFEKSPKSLEYFSEVLDNELMLLNSDYEAKRTNNMVLSKPEINELTPGTFYNWMKNQNKLGGQHKIPRLSNDRSYVDDLMQMV
jgi:hypothetical protein